jgi:hypothetical protein
MSLLSKPKTFTFGLIGLFLGLPGASFLGCFSECGEHGRYSPDRTITLEGLTRQDWVVDDDFGRW